VLLVIEAKEHAGSFGSKSQNHIDLAKVSVIFGTPTKMFFQKIRMKVLAKKGGRQTTWNVGTTA
jgi:hypothetical protein